MYSVAINLGGGSYNLIMGHLISYYEKLKQKPAIFVLVHVTSNYIFFLSAGLGGNETRPYI